MEDINKWEENILYALDNISDLNKQKLIWMVKLPNFASSFTEEIGTLYDDYDFEGYIKYLIESKGKSEVLISNLIKLNDKINAYLKTEEKSDEEILKDSEWIDITTMTKKVISIWKQ